MKKAAIFPTPTYFDRYINQVPDLELEDAFTMAYKDLESFDVARYEPRGDWTYAPGKWTIKDVFLHMIDTERVFMFRAMSFARNDKGPLAGFDQDKFAANGLTKLRTLESLVEEMKYTRKATEAMFNGFSEAVLLRTGISWKYEMSVIAMGFTIIGHQIHHMQILKERYL